MQLKPSKISLIYFVTVTLLLVGLVPLVLTGWLLSERSAQELRSVENRYQIQLVQEKGRQMEMFGQKYGNLVKNLSDAIEISNNVEMLALPQTEQKLGETLREDPNVLGLYVKPAAGESLSLFRLGVIGEEELKAISADALLEARDREVFIGSPKKTASSSDSVMTMVSHAKIDNRSIASIVAVVSLREIAKNIVGTNAGTEADLWKAGLPIIFVVDQDGNAIFHPDEGLADSQKSLTNLKIVNEWQQSNRQIQSGLV
ncbi:MAG: hypothetical protein ACR2M8_05530, partial [Pyrinomonadaceae bacterium]